MTKKNTENKNAAFNIPIFTPENKTRLEEFYEKYGKSVTIGLLAVLVILAAFFVYKKKIVAPKDTEAANMMYMAELYFAKDSFELALNGKMGINPDDETFYGFIDIMDEFGMTKTGNLAKYYAGLCCLRLGEYEDAVDYLSKFKTESEILKPLSLGALGDAYSEMEEYEKAVGYYFKAAKAKHNKFTAPLFYMKAGETLEYIEDYTRALEAYETVKNEYPETQEGNNADKYIGRVKAKIANS